VRRLLTVLLAIVVTGCSSHGGDLPTPARPATVDPTPHGSGTPAADCRPSPRVTVTSRRPRVLYALRFSVASGARSKGAEDVALYTYPVLSPGVHVDRPDGAQLDPRTANALLAEVPRGTTLLDGIRGLSWDVRNDGPTRSRYLVYAGATVYTARWSVRSCEGSGRRVQGTMVLIGRIRESRERCGEPRPDGRLRRLALRTGCHHDPLSDRVFRHPAG
jgi:hypothetical protein